MIEPHHPQVLLDESRISEQIIHESNLWIAKKMLNGSERKIVIKQLYENHKNN